MFSLGDATLTDDDIGLLRPGRWLNDALITFYFEVLTRMGAKGHPLPSDCLLLSPITVFMMLSDNGLL